MDSITVKFALMRPTSQMPVRGSKTAAGYDLFADLGLLDEIVLKPGQVFKVGTGVKMAPPEGYHAELHIRSSIGGKSQVRLANSTGIIDSDYRGEIQAVLINDVQPELQMSMEINDDGDLVIQEPTDGNFVLKNGERFAQLVFHRTINVDAVEVIENELEETERGEGGFGSTGK